MAQVSRDRIERGMEQFRKMVGEERARGVRAQWHRISPDFETFVLGVLSGEVWTRTELDLRTRSLVTIAALTALGRSRGLALNVEMALENGATRREVGETILQMAFYAGFPAAWEGMQVAAEVFDKLDAEKPC